MSISPQRVAALAAAFCIALTLAGCGTQVPVNLPEPQPSDRPGASSSPTSPFAALPGWDTDDLRAAWPAYLASCKVLGRKAEWQPACREARAVDASDNAAIHRHFEQHFTLRQLTNSDGTETGLATGYYEPMLSGSRQRGGAYQTPLLSKPDDLLTVDLRASYPQLRGGRPRGRRDGNHYVPYLTRAEIAQSPSMARYVILWVDNPVDAFFMQVQGSGRVRLAETGEIVRLAYADTNGYPYKSIGRYLIDQGELTAGQASAQGIKGWVALNPDRAQDLLNVNPAYIFFREERLHDPQQGPKGALGVPLTPRRSIAVDPHYVPLGAPVFLATTEPGGSQPLNTLVFAQDTGSAIKGAVRADYFWGFGAEAGEHAGRMKQRTRMWILLPNTLALR